MRSSAEPPPKYSIMIHNLVPYINEKSLADQISKMGPKKLIDLLSYSIYTISAEPTFKYDPKYLVTKGESHWLSTCISC